MLHKSVTDTPLKETHLRRRNYHEFCHWHCRTYEMQSRLMTH